MPQSQAKAKFDFKAEGADELSVTKGETLQLLSAAFSDGWIQAQTLGGPLVRQGLVPVSYLAMDVQAHRAASSAPPALSAQAAAPSSVAVEHAECPICFDEMHSRAVAVFKAANGKRTCRHFLHLNCAQSLAAAHMNTCPVCRAPFATCFEVPNYEKNPQGWFKAVDADGNGKLSRAEVLEILRAICPVDWRRLEARAADLWQRWDANGDGEISYEEFCHPRDGLLAYVKSTFARRGGGGGEADAPPPQLTLSSKKQWFAHFDDDGSGSLEQEEVVRGLIKTFDLRLDLFKLNEMRQTVLAVWPLFDLDGSDSIDMEEFCSRDGLADTIIASSQHLAAVASGGGGGGSRR
jgi:Ca2+-binding EF-hand superfamily protein